MQLSTNSAIQAIHRGVDISTLDLLDQYEQDVFNYYSDQYCDDIVINPDTSIDHEQRQLVWRYPSAYDELDVDSFLLNKCTTEKQRDRVTLELTLFRERNLMKLLRWAIWFMDYVVQNNEFIGVGRGSSVASYALYLIGIHLIDSIEYDLDPREFLK